jgi:hypothetical protein
VEAESLGEPDRREDKHIETHIKILTRTGELKSQKRRDKGEGKEGETRGEPQLLWANESLVGSV